LDATEWGTWMWQPQQFVTAIMAMTARSGQMTMNAVGARYSDSFKQIYGVETLAT